MMFYRVVTEDMRSLGLKNNPNIITYPRYTWIRHESPVEGKSDAGGYWASTTITAARELMRYMMDKHGVKTRLFHAEGAGILYRSKRRVKLRGIMLRDEIE